MRWLRGWRCVLWTHIFQKLLDDSDEQPGGVPPSCHPTASWEYPWTTAYDWTHGIKCSTAASYQEKAVTMSWPPCKRPQEPGVFFNFNSWFLGEIGIYFSYLPDKKIRLQDSRKLPYSTQLRNRLIGTAADISHHMVLDQEWVSPSSGTSTRVHRPVLRQRPPPSTLAASPASCSVYCLLKQIRL